MDPSLLIKNLENPLLFNHPILKFEVIETHISWVLLTGLFAYKIKKAVNLGFVDYSSLEKRYHYCKEEFRLNKKLTPFLYLKVIPIFGTLTDPSFKKNGAPIEYAVKMRQFNQSLLLTHFITHHKISNDKFIDFAKEIAHFHLHANATRDSVFGDPIHIQKPMCDNFTECEDKILSFKKINHHLLSQLSFIKNWSLDEFTQKNSLFQKRKRHGFIRDCHGDLYLHNMVLLKSKIIAFDRIEFNSNFRWIDVINEIAFLIMDLEEHHQHYFAYLFLNQYLEITGDYEGLELLNFYKVYRAMIRAKVALAMPLKDSTLLFKNYIDYATKVIQFKEKKPLLLITFGVSGSGKTYYSQQLASKIAAIHIRSDVERKRMFFLHEKKDNLYTDERTNKTYERLLDISELLLTWGYSVIVDATFLEKKFRDKFLNLAERQKIPYKILFFDIPQKTIMKHIYQRQKKTNVSDATISTLEFQLRNTEPLTENELNFSINASLIKKLKFEELDRLLRNNIL